MIGAITLAVIQNIINLSGLNPAWETLVVGAIILAAVIVDRLVGLAAAKTRAPTGPRPTEPGSGPAVAKA